MSFFFISNCEETFIVDRRVWICVARISMELLCSKCAREAKQVFWLHPNHTSSRAINIGDEEVRNRNGKGQDDKQHTHSMCTVTDQEVTTDGDYFQQDPGFGRDSVPPGG